MAHVAPQSAFYLHYAAQLQESLAMMPWDHVHAAVGMIVKAWETGRHVYIMGNGGSAATATHLACDLSKNTAQAGLPRLRAVSLNDNVAIISALANDVGYEHIFAEQVRTLVEPHDLVVAISTSGNSPNVLYGVEEAVQRQARTIALCGYAGGQLSSMVDLAVVAPNQSVEQIEDIHMMLAHMITVAVRREMHSAMHRRNGHD
jgi:D-sedoheptulose 7-phosphate isomerase